MVEDLGRGRNHRPRGAPIDGAYRKPLRLLSCSYFGTPLVIEVKLDGRAKPLPNASTGRSIRVANFADLLTSGSQVREGRGEGIDYLVEHDPKHTILLVFGYNKPKSEPTPEQSHHCDTRPIWTPWGWGVDRKRLVWLMTNWCTRNPKCFTCNFRSQYQRTRKELFPVLSRIQNIGYELGENSRTAEWYRANHRTPWVANDQPRSPFSIPTS